jgi:endoglucanase
LIRKITFLAIAITSVGCTSLFTPSPAYSAHTSSPNLIFGSTSSFDGDTGSWTSNPSAAVSDVASPVQSGTGALRVEAKGQSPVNVWISSGHDSTTWTAASPGVRYTTGAYVRADSQGRAVAALEVFYDGTGSQLAAVWGSATTDSTSTWTATDPVVGIAPAASAYVTFGLLIHGAATDEIHYVDSASIYATAVNPTPLHSPFHTSGNRIYGSNGAPVVFRGIHRDGSQLAYPLFPSDAEIAQARAWGANFIRVPLSESLWINTCPSKPTNPWWYPGAVDAEVKHITSRGMVALLDLHFSVTGQCTPAAQQAMADASYAKTFWSTLAARYKANPLVAFDLYNEPHNISDAVWLNGGTATYASTTFNAVGMQQLYNAVRAQGATNLVFISGNNWAVQPAVRLVSGTNIVNAAHAYTCGDGPPPGCKTPDYYNPNYILNHWVTLGASQPVMVTEFGWPDKNSDIFNRNVVASAEYRGWGWDAFAWDGSTYGLYGLVASTGATYEPAPAGMPILSGLANN